LTNCTRCGVGCIQLLAVIEFATDQNTVSNLEAMSAVNGICLNKMIINLLLSQFLQCKQISS